MTGSRWEDGVHEWSGPIPAGECWKKCHRSHAGTNVSGLLKIKCSLMPWDSHIVTSFDWSFWDYSILNHDSIFRKWDQLDGGSWILLAHDPDNTDMQVLQRLFGQLKLFLDFLLLFLQCSFHIFFTLEAAHADTTKADRVTKASQPPSLESQMAHPKTIKNLPRSAEFGRSSINRPAMNSDHVGERKIYIGSTWCLMEYRGCGRNLWYAFPILARWYSFNPNKSAKFAWNHLESMNQNSKIAFQPFPVRGQASIDLLNPCLDCSSRWRAGWRWKPSHSIQGLWQLTVLTSEAF